MLYFILILVLAALSLYFYSETHTLSVSFYDIDGDDLPEEFDGFRIIHVSDLHNTRNRAIIRQMDDLLAAQKCDMIAFTGDLVDSRQTDWKQAKVLSDVLKKAAPVYFVTGNHEERLLAKESDAQEKLNDMGMIMLTNKVEYIKRNGQRLQLAGVDDPRRSGRSTGSLPNEFILTELDELPLEKNLFTVLLSHRPEYLDQYAERGYDLVLAGHAHGAQFILPGIGGVYAPNQGLFPKLYKGLHVKGKTRLIISRGLGGKEFPIRINNKPEIAVITLKKNTQQ